MYASARQRTLSALAALLTVAGGMLALMSGLAFTPTSIAPHGVLETILPTRDAAPKPPEPKPPPKPSKAEDSAPREAPAPPARKNNAAPFVAPSPPMPPLIQPPPVLTARVAGTGSAASSGASDRDGPGQGAGGSGTGTGGGGSGGSGSGAGDGNGNVARLPRQVSGKLHYWEIPKELRRAQAGGVIRLRYRIGIDGRVSGCMVLASSGFPDFDRDTCARITERFRFRPARDAQGRPVPYVMTEIHGWDSTGEWGPPA